MVGEGPMKILDRFCRQWDGMSVEEVKVHLDKFNSIPEKSGYLHLMHDKGLAYGTITPKTRISIYENLVELSVETLKAMEVVR